MFSSTLFCSKVLLARLEKNKNKQSHNIKSNISNIHISRYQPLDMILLSTFMLELWKHHCGIKICFYIKMVGLNLIFLKMHSTRS